MCRTGHNCIWMRIFFEEAEYYFDGAKGLEETMDVIQSKVSLYVNERI